MVRFRERARSNERSGQDVSDVGADGGPRYRDPAKPTFKPVGFRTGNGSKSQAALADASDTPEPARSPKDGDKPPR